MVKIRLTRKGAKKKPFYRVVVMDSRKRRDGPFIEIIGTYDPMKEPSAVDIKSDRAEYWLSKGAQASDTVKRLMKQAGGKTA